MDFRSYKILFFHENESWHYYGIKLTELLQLAVSVFNIYIYLSNIFFFFTLNCRKDLPLEYIKIQRKNFFACLFSVHNTISLSFHEQVCLVWLRFEIYFSHYQAR